MQSIVALGIMSHNVWRGESKATSNHYVNSDTPTQPMVDLRVRAPLPPRAALSDVGEHLVVAGVRGDVERGPALPRGARGVGSVGHQQLGEGEAAAAAGGLQRRAAVPPVAVDVDLLGVAREQPVQLLVSARLHRRLELKEGEATRVRRIPRPKRILSPIETCARISQLGHDANGFKK